MYSCWEQESADEAAEEAAAVAEELGVAVSSGGKGDELELPPVPFSGSRADVLPGGRAGVLPCEDAAAAEASWREAQSLARECGWSEVVTSDWAKSKEVGAEGA